MVENFGLHLKHERELRGVSLEEIAESTRIHIRYLEALENNEFDKMPGEVFVKGYIRSYARVIGFDSEEMVNVYDESVGKDRKKELGEIELTQDNVKSGKKKTAGYIFLGLALTAGLLLGYSFFGDMIDKNKKQQARLPAKETPAKQGEPEVSSDADPAEKIEFDIDEQNQDNNPENSQNAADSVEIETPATPTDPTSEMTGEEGTQNEDVGSAEPVVTTEPSDPQEDKKEEPKTPIESAVMEKNPPSVEKPVIIQQVMEDSPAPVPSGQSLSEMDVKPLRLKIQVQGNSWFNVTVDNSKEEDFILPGGSSKNVYGREKIQLTIGNRNGTKLFLNEQPIDLPPGSSDVIRNFDITANLLE